MFLKEIYKAGLAHGIDDCYVGRGLSWIIDVTKDKPEYFAAEKGVIYRLPFGVVRSSNITPNYIYDTAEYIFGIGGSGARKKMAFLDFVETVFARSGEDSLKKVIGFLASNPPPPEGAKPKDFCAFRIGKMLITDFPKIENDLRVNGDARQKSGKITFCASTGVSGYLCDVLPKIRIAGGGTGVPLVSFDKPASCHYGFSGNENCGIDEKSAYVASGMIQALLNNKNTSFFLGRGRTLILWSDSGINLAPVFRGKREDVERLLEDIAKAYSKEKEYSNKTLLGAVLNASEGRIGICVDFSTTVARVLDNLLKFYSVFPHYPIWQLVGCLGAKHFSGTDLISVAVLGERLPKKYFLAALERYKKDIISKCRFNIDVQAAFIELGLSESSMGK